MALYVVVHHRQDPDQPWPNNVWLDDQRLQAIETTAEIGRLCDEAKHLGQRVHVHRCRWGNNAPSICCSAQAARVVRIDRRSSLVEFSDIQPSDGVPPSQPRPGQNHYHV